MSSALDVGTHTTFQRQKIPTLHHLGAGYVVLHFYCVLKQADNLVFCILTEREPHKVMDGYGTQEHL